MPMVDNNMTLQGMDLRKWNSAPPQPYLVGCFRTQVGSLICPGDSGEVLVPTHARRNFTEWAHSLSVSPGQEGRGSPPFWSSGSSATSPPLLKMGENHTVLWALLSRVFGAQSEPGPTQNLFFWEQISIPGSIAPFCRSKSLQNLQFFISHFWSPCHIHLHFWVFFLWHQVACESTLKACWSPVG